MLGQILLRNYILPPRGTEGSLFDSSESLWKCYAGLLYYGCNPCHHCISSREFPTSCI